MQVAEQSGLSSMEQKISSRPCIRGDKDPAQAAAGHAAPGKDTAIRGHSNAWKRKIQPLEAAQNAGKKKILPLEAAQMQSDSPPCPTV